MTLLAAFVFVMAALPAQQTSPEAAQANELFRRAQQAKPAGERIRLLTESLRLWKTVEAHLALGRAQMDAGQTEPAAESFRLAYELAAPAERQVRSHALYQWALALEAAGRRLEAVQLVRAAVAVGPHPFLDEELGRLQFAASQTITPAAEIRRGLLHSRDLYFEKTAPTYKSKISIDLFIQFDYDSDALTPQGVAQVKELGTVLTGPDLSGKTIDLVGHTDSRGGAEHNESLSLRRARAVREYLLPRFALSAAKIEVRGMGSRQPLSKGTQERDHAINRRVEVIVE